MRNRYAKMAITITVLCLAFAGLLWATLREGAEYYKYVDEVVAERTQWEGRRLQVHGNVVPGSIMRKRDTLDYIFKVERNGAVLDVTYSGAVPDTFKDESEVVLKGVLTANVFQTEPRGITAKCPSKYDEAIAIGAAGQGGL